MEAETPPVPFGGLMKEQGDSLWSTIFLNEEVDDDCFEEDVLQAFANKL